MLRGKVGALLFECDVKRFQPEVKYRTIWETTIFEVKNVYFGYSLTWSIAAMCKMWDETSRLPQQQESDKSRWMSHRRGKKYFFLQIKRL